MVEDLIELLADAGLGDIYARKVVYEVVAGAWDEGYAARANEDHLSPGESNPYREEN